MDFQAFKQEIIDFYWNKVDGMADAFKEKLFPILDERDSPTFTAGDRREFTPPA